MPKIIAGHASALPIVALVGAAAIGAWLGFSSCGGYVWHTYVGYSVLALAVLVALLGPGSVARRAGLAALALVAFFAARGAGFASYVGADNPSEYLRQVGSTFTLGLC